MHVGMATVFQNTGRALSDHQIYLNELALADMAEPLGFELIWARRAPFHRLHDVPRRRAVPVLHGRPHEARAAGLDGGGAAVARPDAGRPSRSRCSTICSGGRMILGLGPRRGQGRVRRLPARHGRQPRAVRRIRRGAPEGPRERRDGISRQALQAAARPPSAPRPFKSLPRPHLCRGREPRERTHHGQARRRPPDHPAEAVARGREGAHRVQHALSRDQRQRRAAADLGRLDLRRRERRARARDGDELHRRLLPHGARPLPVRRLRT